ncbi:MAG: DNA polymerase III subunit delta [Phycisphaerae bacterium]|nr:DNA polymerase III subunit delta [Phycisphaerae bacterium]
MAKSSASAPPVLDASKRVVVLHGKDTYLLSEYVKRVRAALADKFGGFDEFNFDGSTASLAQVLDELRSWGLIQSHKLVVVDNAEDFLRAEERRRAVERYVEDPMQDATLILRSAIWRPGNIDKLITKIGGAIIKCEPPDDDKAKIWCERRSVKHYEIPIDPDAAALLVERLGPDLARLDTELGKLAATVCDRPTPRITRKDVAEMVGVDREEQAWVIQDAILTGDAKTALTKLHELLEISQAPEQLIVWSTVELARKIHDASRLFAQGEPDFAVGKALKLWGASQSAILRIGRKVPPAAAARLLDAAVQLDLSVRRGTTRNLARRLQGFSVELTDTFGR